MTDLTERQIQQLREATKALFASSMESAKEIPGMLKRAAKGRDESLEILRKRAETTAEAELRTICEVTQRAHVQIFERILNVAESAGNLPKQLSAVASPAIASVGQDEALKNLDPAAVLATAKASQRFDPALRELAVSLGIFPLVTAIEAYTATNESFLEHKAGSVNPGERMKRVLKAFLKDVAATPLPPFFDTFREVIRQLTESQIDRDIAEITAETGDRLYRLRRLQQRVEVYADFANDMLEMSRQTSMEAVANEQAVMAKVKALLSCHEPPSSTQ